MKVNGTIEKTNYNKVIEVDGIVIFADKEEYFMFEHYPSNNGSYYAIPVYLGKTGKEVHRTISELNDWNYRVWHIKGEGEKIIKWGEQLDNLPDIN